MHGMIEYYYRRLTQRGVDKHTAFARSAEQMTGVIRRMISHTGMLSVVNSLTPEGKKEFEVAYSAAYPPLHETLLEIYEEVASGREISSVIDHTMRFDRYPMKNVETTETWKVGAEVRKTWRQDASKQALLDTVDPTAAGVYLACIVAQSDVLLNAGHCYSEVANESIIEGVDSLSPYLHAKGVAHMIDNCSVTARLGARKWAPRFDYLLWQQADGPMDAKKVENPDLVEKFYTHKIHDILKVCSEFRPPVDISLQSD